MDRKRKSDSVLEGHVSESSKLSGEFGASAIREELDQKRKSNSVLDGHVSESSKTSGKIFFTEEKNALSATRDALDGHKMRGKSSLKNTGESSKKRGKGSLKNTGPFPSPSNTEIDSVIEMNDFLTGIDW